MDSKATDAVTRGQRVGEREFFHLIDGRTVAGADFFDVINPATGRPFARCPDGTREQLDQAVAAARRAFPTWAATSLDERRAALRGLAAVLRANLEELAEIITLEQGKTLVRARDEVERSALQMENLIQVPLPSSPERDTERARIAMRYRPLGVVGAITPWNMPLVLCVPKIAHALYTGNTIVVKPSPYTPLSSLRLGELASAVFPAGVLNIVAGGNAMGEWMTSHPDINKISFTGSVPTGKKVMASAAGTLKRITLELGGNDAAIVLDDVDVDAVAPQLFGAAFVNSGQICMAIKRLFVQRGVYERLSQALAELARKAKVGDGFEEGVTLGPVQNAAQYRIVKDILQDARERGATFLAGGAALEREGYFIAPTIVTGLAEGSRLVDEEPFGPVLPILPFDDPQEAVARANATSYGLGASVWSTNHERAAQIAGQLEAGTVWINRHIGVDADVPFGGAKQSGMGCEYGTEGLKAYMQPYAVYLPK